MPKTIKEIEKEIDDLDEKFDEGKISSRADYRKQLKDLNEELVEAKVAESKSKSDSAKPPKKDESTAFTQAVKDERTAVAFQMANKLAIKIYGDIAKLDSNFEGNKHLTDGILETFGNKMVALADGPRFKTLLSDQHMQKVFDDIHKENYNSKVANPTSPKKKIEDRDEDKDEVDKSKIAEKDGAHAADTGAVNKKTQKIFENMMAGKPAEEGRETDKHDWRSVMNVDTKSPDAPMTEQGDDDGTHLSP